VRLLDATFRLSTSQHYIDFLRSAASPVIEILASLIEPERRDVWDDMEVQLQVFTTPSGWVGPNELLLATATVAQNLPATD
jgi:hypothetical protein